MIVKICGLTNLDDARRAWDAGADFLGFVLYSKSPRGISADQLARIADRLPAEARMVGVFVNASRELVETVAAACRLSAVQMHGDEAPGAGAGAGRPVWRAVRWQEGQWKPSPDGWPADRYVADAASAAYGGSGQLADWRAAAVLAREVPVMLAGGLTADNVAQAIEAVRPLGVDVASGVEAEPGRKDARAMIEFIRRAHDAG